MIRVSLKECAPLQYGKALKKSVRLSGDIPVYGSSGVVGFHDKSLILGNSIIVGRKGTVGSVYYSSKPCWPIDTVFYIDADHANLYIYFTLKEIEFVSGDAAVPGLNRNYAHSLKVIVPDDQLRENFEALAGTLFQQIILLEKQNNQLKQARDQLLPKMMSGQLDINSLATTTNKEE